MTEEEWAIVAAEHRERERKNTVHCPHCGTPGEWTYGGPRSEAWLSTEDARKLTEFLDTFRWDGTHSFGRDHTIERCHAVLKARLQQLNPVNHHEYGGDGVCKWCSHDCMSSGDNFCTTRVEVNKVRA